MAELKRKSKQQQNTQRRKMVQGVQREYLLDSMKMLLSTNKKEINKKTVWQNITNELNKLGPTKEPTRWRKCWSDLVLRLRKRILQQQEKYQITLTDNTNCYKNLKLSTEDIKILKCYGGIELLFKDCSRKIKDGKIETISIADSSDNDDLYFDNQNDSQMSFLYNGNNTVTNYDNSSIPDEKLQLDISEMCKNNKIIKNDSRIIDNQMIVESSKSNSINTRNSLNQNSLVDDQNNEMDQSFSIADHIKESLKIQKQTYEEICRLGAVQMETNNLMRILIERLTTTPPDHNEKHMTEIRLPEDHNLSMLSVKLEEVNHNGLI